jgi:phosphoribosylanthranilate isomerase
MIVQIYTMQTPEEAVSVVKLGVDHIGVTPSNKNLPGEIDIQTTKDIFAAVGNKATKVALSVDENLDDIEAMVRATLPDVLHLCGDIKAVPVDAVLELRRRLPGMKIMQAIPVTGPEAVKQAIEFQNVAEFLILDSKSEDVTGIGATGSTHDWNISREIVENTRIPVILAGGLTAENVVEAIENVHPWGVDSLTHTNFPLGEGRFRKDLEKIEAFVKAAKGL